MTVRRRVRSGTASLVAGAVLIGTGTAALLWPERRVAAEAGSVLAAPAHPASVGEAADRNPSRVAGSVSASARAGFAPDRLLVASLQIDAPLTATLVDADGALVPPDDPARLAWWRGVRPGAGAGSVIVAGHLDMHRYGRGALARIVDLEVGDRAVLTGADGATATYAVHGVATIGKDALPAAELFGTGGPERLVLVTCGGTYDRSLRSWDSNVVATLHPLPAG